MTAPDAPVEGEPLEVVVGRVGRPHGVRGDVTVEVRTDDPGGRFAPGSLLRTDPDRGPLEVADAREHSGRLLVRFRGVDDRGAAEALRDLLLLVDVDPRERPDDPEEWYDHQVVGLRAATVDGRDLGAVTEVLHLPGQDVLVLRAGDGPELLVPFVAAIVPEVDTAAGRLVVDPPPGLLGDPAGPGATAPEAPGPGATAPGASPDEADPGAAGSASPGRG